MDRADKIFTALCGAALVAVLLWRRGAPAGLNVPATPGNTSDLGPAYLLSNNPIRRRRDDLAPDASC